MELNRLNRCAGYSYLRTGVRPGGRFRHERRSSAGDTCTISTGPVLDPDEVHGTIGGTADVHGRERELVTAKRVPAISWIQAAKNVHAVGLPSSGPHSLGSI